MNTESFPRYSQNASRKPGVIVRATGATALWLETITLGLLGWRIFDVYLNERRDLLVVSKGLPIPAHKPGRWRKSEKKVLKVSDEIKSTVQRQGYYIRKLSDAEGDRRVAVIEPIHPKAMPVIPMTDVERDVWMHAP
jgi:hypothetical protein